MAVNPSCAPNRGAPAPWVDELGGVGLALAEGELEIMPPLRSKQSLLLGSVPVRGRIGWWGSPGEMITCTIKGNCDTDGV